MTDDKRWVVINEDCREAMSKMEAESVDSIVTDPPYGLSFMGKGWDHGVPGVPFWIEALRVAKPGAHLLAFGGTRTFHRLAVAIEDAGWEIRDTIMWVYGSGFPKGMNPIPAIVRGALCQSQEHVQRAVQISTPIRVALREGRQPIVAALALILPEGAVALITETGGEVALSDLTDTSLLELKECIGLSTTLSWNGSLDDVYSDTSKCITSTAKEVITDQKTYNWLTGLHTSANTTQASVTLANGLVWPAVNVNGNLSAEEQNKPGIPIVTALGNAMWNPVVKWTGYNVALKPAWEPVIVARKPLVGTVAENVLRYGTGAINIDACRVQADDLESLQKNWDRVQSVNQGIASAGLKSINLSDRAPSGRWPANVIHDGSDEVIELFPQANSGFRVRGRGGHVYANGKGFSNTLTKVGQTVGYGDSGSAARFFYSAKASKTDRDEGLNDFPTLSGGEMTDRKDGSAGTSSPRAGAGRTGDRKNSHPTVKPTDLMRYMCRLVTPPNGIVLDPFMGSGSTGKAAVLEGFRFVGVDLEKEYCDIASARIEHAAKQKK